MKSELCILNDTVTSQFQLDRLTVSIAVRFLLAKTAEDRAAVDLDTHYSQVN